MTYLFDLNPVEQRGAFQTAAENATDIVNAPFFEGMGTGLVSGGKSAYYRDIYNSANPQREADLQQNAIDQLQKLKPDPRSVGTAGQILYGLGDVLGTVYAQLMGGNITPQMLAIETGKSYGKSQEQLYIRQGIDPDTARKLAATDAAAVGLGVVMPAAVPGRLATRAMSGGVINAAIGTGQRAALSYELESAGYADLARQYAPFDAAGVVTDFALGAFFGGVMGPRPVPPEARGRVLPSDVDGTLTMNNAAHIETGTIPGMPTDSISRQAHVDAVSKALDDLMNGRPVDVGEQITRAPFEPKGESLLRQEMTVEVEQHLSQQLQSLKAELERRGLTTEDIDQTAPVTLRETTPGMPGSAAIREAIPNAAVGGKNADQTRVNELLSIEGVFDEAQLARLPEAEQGVLRNLYQRAAQLKDAFDQIGQEIAQQVGGKLLIPNIKGSERAVAKITTDLAGKAGGIKDLLRATIEVDSVDKARVAIDLLQQRFQVLESGYRDLFDRTANPIDGYRDAKMNIQLDGIVAEMQVNLPAMLEAKKQVHSKYVERSAIERASEGRQRTDAEQAKIDQLNAEMKDVYDAAFASAIKDANLAPETGEPFLRADSELNGRGGSVSQAAQENLTPGTLPSETGMPSTSKSSTLEGKSTGITSVDNIPEKLGNVNLDAQSVAQTLKERPDLTITDENGQAMLASDALAQADAEIAAAMREAPGFDAAVSCALRNS